MKVKDDFHHLIDEITDEKQLKEYYDLIQRLAGNQPGKLWNMLNSDQQQDLLLAYEESFDPANLISHEEMEAEHKKWLRK